MFLLEGLSTFFSSRVSLVIPVAVLSFLLYLCFSLSVGATHENGALSL